MSRRLLTNALSNKYGTVSYAAVSSNFTVPNRYGTYYLHVNASSGDVDITLPAISDLQNRYVYVSMHVNPSGNKVRVLQSGGSELWTGYAISDYLLVGSQGSVYTIFNESTTVYGHLALTSSESISANSSQKVFDVNYSEETDIGGWWDSVTNHRLTAAYACLLHCDAYFEGAASIPMVMELLVNGTPTVNKGAGGSTGEHAVYHSWQLELAATDTVVVNCFNDSASAQNLVGAAGKDRTQFRWNVIRRIR